MKFKKGFYKCDEVDSMMTARDILQYAKKKYAGSIAYRQIEDKIYESAITFRGLADNVDALGTALLMHGLKDKHVALLGETSVEWVTSYFAVLNGVGVVVPIDRELNVETLIKQFNFGDIDAVICSEKSLKKFLEALPYCPNIKDLIIMRSNQADNTIPCANVFIFDELLKEGRTLLKRGDGSYINAVIDPDAMSELVFTSGTTGANKGVMLCHKNLSAVIRGARRLVNYKGTSISVLPVNHTYELSCHIIACIYEGTTVCINDDLKHVMQNIEHFAPEMTCMVPMMVDLIVRKIKIESEKSGLSEYMKYGMKFSNLIRKVGIDKREKYFHPILTKFGGKLNKIICGGAPLSQETIDFMDTIGVSVLNGYGITECAPLVAVNGDKLKRKGSVGHVLPVCEVRIVSPDENGNGEIQVKGDNVMLGYYKMPEDTAKVFTEDGWFCTGDIGHVDKDDFLFINGRVKNLIILSNGKNVYPEEVEDAMQHTIPYLKEVVAFADAENTGIYAICYIDPDFCRENGILNQLDKHDYLMKDIKKYNQKMPSFKRITDVVIAEEEFEKTSTKKIKRFQVLERSKQNV